MIFFTSCYVFNHNDSEHYNKELSISFIEQKSMQEKKILKLFSNGSYELYIYPHILASYLDYNSFSDLKNKLSIIKLLTEKATTGIFTDTTFSLNNNIIDCISLFESRSFYIYNKSTGRFVKKVEIVVNKFKTKSLKDSISCKLFIGSFLFFSK